MAAIDHGADAVYIGAPRFGARAAAVNSVDDIAALCRYAHRFDAKVYAAVNTIIYDDELAEAEQLINELSDAGVDAVLVQDMSLLSVFEKRRSKGLRTPDIHASTQTDNRSKEKTEWLRSLGFRRVVLARELSADEIKGIRKAVPDVELETFVHGALCVSYSGQCYASQYCYNRSANRGACAQFCRLPFNLEDSDGRVWERERHLLSLKDLCLIDHLEELLEAGVTSLKIEGRLKDIGYVKNVTAAYSEALNRIIARNLGRFRRASRGICTYTFIPDVRKTFHRGFTTYFLKGREQAIFSPDTPKAVGECVGTVKEIKGRSFTVAGLSAFANGDGLCFFNKERDAAGGTRTVLEGFRVNRAEGNRLFPLQLPASLRPGTVLYRNNDQALERLLSKPSAERRIPVRMVLSETADGFSLAMTDGARTQSVSISDEKQPAKTPQQENIIRQLTKLGGTAYVCEHVELQPADFSFFIPSSRLADLRRRVVEAFEAETTVGQTASDEETPRKEPPVPAPYNARYTYLYNAANGEARSFYAARGVPQADAFEGKTWNEPLIMQCRHCLRFSLGFCERRGGQHPRWHEPLFLVSGDGRRFRLEFDCKNCQMNVYATSHP